MTRARIVGVLVTLVIAVAYAFELVFEEDAETGAVDWVFLAAILVVAIVFWWIEVMHTIAHHEGNTPAVAGLVCSLVAAAGLLVFWTGVPLFVGAGAVVLGVEGYERSKHGEGRRGMAMAAIAIGALVVGAWIPVFVFG